MPSIRSTAAAEPVPPGVCPLCGAGNACAMAGRGGTDLPCWCVGASFSDDLLERVPPAARGRACICAACAAGARRDVNHRSQA
jgi:Cysteine-rich CWC